MSCQRVSVAGMKRVSCCQGTVLLLPMCMCFVTSVGRRTTNCMSSQNETLTQAFNLDRKRIQWMFSPPECTVYLSWHLGSRCCPRRWANCLVWQCGSRPCPRRRANCLLWHLGPRRCPRRWSSKVSRLVPAYNKTELSCTYDLWRGKKILHAPNSDFCLLLCNEKSALHSISHTAQHLHELDNEELTATSLGLLFGG